MKKLISLVCLFSFLLFAPATLMALPVSVYFEGPSDVVLGETFQLDLKADIPEAVLGFGLDLSFDSNFLSLLGPPSIGPLWGPAFAPDGDGLAGIAFPPVFGNNILLAGFQFEALQVGSTSLTTSYTVGDLTEGFPLSFPAPPGSFADVEFQTKNVDILAPATAPIPEPSTLVLLFLGGSLILFLKKRSIKRSMQ